MARSLENIPNNELNILNIVKSFQLTGSKRLSEEVGECKGENGLVAGDC
jgi:hypothetical protein